MTPIQTLRNISLADLYKDSFDIRYDNNPQLISIAMSLDLLSKIYGREWMSKYILTNKIFKSLQDNSNDNLTEFKFHNRILTLGECLYNLKKIEGIENVLEELDKGNVEPVISELESGRLIYHRGLNFKYVKRTLKKGSDFDIHIIDKHHEIFCETKCKLNSTKYSDITFYESLDNAIRQLPPHNNPLIILIKTPYEWIQHDDELKKIAAEYVKKIESPLCIIGWRDHWFISQRQNDIANKVVTGFEEHNDKSKIFNANLIPFLPSSQNTPGWTEFQKFAAGLL